MKGGIKKYIYIAHTRFIHWPKATLTYTQTLAVDLVRPASVVSEGFDAAFQVDEEGLQKGLPRVQSFQSLWFMETADIIMCIFFTLVNSGFLKLCGLQPFENKPCIFVRQMYSINSFGCFVFRYSASSGRQTQQSRSLTRTFNKHAV